MCKKILCLLILFALVLSIKPIYAAGFALTSIGTVDTSGKQISHWWYSGLTPKFTGTAAASDAVTVSLDGTEASTSADVSGSWTYTPATMTSGDHQVVLTSGGSTINFTLTLGADSVGHSDASGSSSSSATSSSLPTTGMSLPTIALIGTSGVLFLMAKKLAC